MAKLLLISILVSFLTLVTANIVYAQDENLTPEDNLAKQQIIANLSTAVDHKYDRYDLLIGSLKGDNSTFTIYNKSGTVPPLVCGPGTHEENGICVPDIPPCPPGQHPENGACVPDTGNITKIDLAGDFLGTSVINAMKSKDADWNVALGDLGYQSTLTTFKSNWDNLNKHLCVIGNHDSKNEDGSSTIDQQAKDYCGDIWFKKIAGGTTILLGFNTNGDLAAQGNTAKGWVTDSTMMDGVKNLIVLTHKPCETHPNSHHGVEANVNNFCTDLLSNIPQGAKVYFISGHNHEIASSTNGIWYVAGGGGQTHHRQCGQDGVWDLCKAKNGFLELEINNNNGDIKSNFYDTNGVPIH